MKKKLSVFLVLSFLVVFISDCYAASPLDSAISIVEYKQKENECREKYEGTKLEICIAEAWLEYQQKSETQMNVRDQESSTRDMRGFVTDKQLVDDLSITGREVLPKLRAKYAQEIWQFNNDHKLELANFDTDVANCKFDEVKGKLRNIVATYSRRYPDSLVVRDAQDQKGLVWSKIDARKKEKDQGEQAAATAISKGNKDCEFCMSWDGPPSLLQSDVLNKCRPDLINQLKQVSEKSKRADADFKVFKTRREEAIRFGESVVKDCGDFKSALQKLNNLNPHPYEKCADLLKQESGPDAVDYVRRDINARVKDLNTRSQNINQILAGTNDVILRCDWNNLERMKQDALHALPEENCLRHYSSFANLRNGINDLDRKVRARIDEVNHLGAKMLKSVMFCEGYMKVPSNNPNSPYNQPSWDENRVKLYNDERTALDYHVKEAYTQGYASCLKDLIARSNALPPQLQSSAPRITWEDGYNRGGSDYKSYKGQAGAKSCQQDCINDLNCKAWTYVKPGTIQDREGRCWLKHSQPGKTLHKDCISGIVNR